MLVDLLRSLLAVLEAVDQGIHIVDRDGVTVVYNRAASVLDGLSEDEVVGRQLLKVFPSLDEGTSTLLRVLKTGVPEAERQQTFTNYKGKKITTVNFTQPIIVDGKAVGACEVSTDITRIKDMAEKIVDLRKELRDREGPGETASPGRLYTVDDIVGESPAMRDAKRRALQVAAGDASVLVWGETGTGKELLVQAIHSASGRSRGPFVPQNCAALPESLLEGLVFGTARGGFTGSLDRPGLLEIASGGTLYLDEIDSMPPGLQVKLLRVIQDKKVRRLGDARERSVDVRIVASTSAKPADAAKQGLLRPDLYYRLSVVEIEIPPLRERREDIPLLCEHFLAKHAGRGGVRTVSAQVMAAFLAYEWPGNVRELEHAIQGSLTFARGPAVEVDDLPAAVRGILAAASVFRDGWQAGAPSGVRRLPRSGRQLKDLLRAQEKEAIESALREGQSVAGASRILDIPRQTLQYRMKVLGIGRG
jgi:arginine utilization regulatory protein